MTAQCGQLGQLVGDLEQPRTNERIIDRGGDTTRIGREVEQLMFQ